MSERQPGGDGVSPFFTSPPVYVLTYEHRPGDLRVATEKADDGGAILCFLSPLDALIEAARITQLGLAYRRQSLS